MSTNTLPETQRAWRVVRKGSPSKALHFDDQVPVPTKLAPGDVLVKVQAAALNPVLVDFNFLKKLAI